MLSAVFRDFSSGKRSGILKHPNHPVNCFQQGSSSAMGDFIVKHPPILSTVFRDFSSGNCGCGLKHPNYRVNCIQGFQLWKVWLCSEAPYLSCQLCTGIVFGDSAQQNKNGCVLKHPHYGEEVCF
jgi:hypothetical protein